MRRPGVLLVLLIILGLSLSWSSGEVQAGVQRIEVLIDCSGQWAGTYTVREYGLGEQWRHINGSGTPQETWLVWDTLSDEGDVEVEAQKQAWGDYQLALFLYVDGDEQTRANTTWELGGVRITYHWPTSEMTPPGIPGYPPTAIILGLVLALALILLIKRRRQAPC